MFNGHANGNGNGSSPKRFVESAAESVFMRGLTRLITIGVTGLGFPAMIAFGVWGLSEYSKKENARDAIHLAQTKALQEVSSTMSLVQYRLLQVEHKNVEQDKRFESTDRRVIRLERTIPIRPNSNWPYNYEGDDPQ